MILSPSEEPFESTMQFQKDKNKSTQHDYQRDRWPFVLPSQLGMQGKCNKLWDDI